MFSCLYKSDYDLERDVTTELNFDRSIPASQIRVSAKDGVVTLRGTVPHYVEKINSEARLAAYNAPRFVLVENSLLLAS